MSETEKRFGITIADEEASAVQTVEGLYLLVMHKTAEPGPLGTDRPCGGCGYNLRGTESTRCPECGHAYVRQDPAAAVTIWKRLTELIAQQSGIERERIKPTSRLNEDLHLD
ncbi:MAG: hypothetical protein AAF333_16210 [Planctomycetota bacterium]